MKENVVRHLRDGLGLGPEEIADIYGVFLHTLSQCLDQLRAAGDPPDFLAVRAATHTLKGFARNVGAADLGDAALALNAAAHAGDAEACRCGIRDVESICNEYRAGTPSAPSQP